MYYVTLGIVFYYTKKKKLYATHLKTKPKKGFEPVITIALQVFKLIKKHNPKIIAIEEPFVFPGRIKGAMRVFYLHALLRYFIYKHKAILYEYSIFLFLVCILLFFSPFFFHRRFLFGGLL